MSNCGRDHKVDILRLLLQQSGGGPAASTGRTRSADGWAPSIDKNKNSMWKLPDQITKHAFRHWLDAMDTYFAAAQHFEYPEVVLDKVRRFEGEIT